MRLRGQHGYAMVVLLIGLSVMAILMTVAMPVWKQATQREKEAELVFRGQQYVRAIGLFQKRAGPGVLPPNLDVLVQQRMLRKKFKDPITGKDFDLLTPTQAAPGGVPVGGPPPPGGRGAPAPPPAGAGAVAAQPGAGRGATGGIMGVASASKDTSIRVYNGRTHYNEWQFLFVQQTQTAGGGGTPGQPQRGGRGQPGQGPPDIGGRGQPGRGGPGTFPIAPFGGGRGPAAPPSPTRPPRD